MRLATTALLAAVLAAGQALASPLLQITEIFPGVSGDFGGNITEDWFEVTNFGDMPWVFATDGDLFYDDDSQDPGTADQLTLPGLTEIAPGQSVVFINSDETPGDGVDDFLAAFPTVDPAIVGFFDGSGLSGGGDGVTLFTGTSLFPLDGIENETLLDFEEYPNLDDLVFSGDVLGAPTYDVLNARFSIVGELGAFSSTTTTELDILGGLGGSSIDDLGNGVGDGVFVAIVGSPGVAVPEPTAAAVALVGLVAAARRRRV